MNEKFLNKTGLGYYHGRAKTIFADKGEFDTLSDKVDEIIAEGGEPNVIETVKVNNTPLVPDSNKAVNIDLSGYAETSDLPTKTSDLINDGDGTSNFATESYVDSNGGKIQKVKVNGTALSIDTTDKSVDITMPTKVSDLTNDSKFQSDTDVEGAIDDALANGSDPYMTESEVDTKIDTALTSSMTYKGTVATYEDLPSTGNKIGDFYNVTADDKNYAWDGTKWDGISGTIDTSLLWAKSELTAITTAEIDTIIGS